MYIYEMKTEIQKENCKYSFDSTMGNFAKIYKRVTIFIRSTMTNFESLRCAFFLLGKL